MYLQIHALVQRYQLPTAQAQQLWRCASGPQGGALPPDGVQGLWRGLALVAALLLGAGLIFAVAAQWTEQSRSVKLLLLEAAVLLPTLAALLLARLRLAGLLLATLALGGLLAFVGQTYQTGADAWQLFALWALLTLVWTLLARSDGLWALWLLIAGAGLGFWSGQSLFNPVPVLFHGGQHFAWQVLLWLPLCAVPWGLPQLRALAVAAPRWSRAMAAALALSAWTAYGLWALFSGSAGVQWALLLLAAGLIAGLLWLARRARDWLVLGLALLAANVLWLAAVGRGLSALSRHFELGLFFVMSVLVATSVALSTQWLYRVQRQEGV